MILSWLIPLFVSIVLLHISGGFIRWAMNLENANDFSRFFLNCITSLLLFVFVYSAWTTQLATVNLGFLVAAGYSFVNLKKPDQTFGFISYLKLSWKSVIVLLLLLIMVLMWNLQVFTGGNYEMIIPVEDYIFYANVSEYLNAFGKENNFLEYFYNEQTSVGPYHYFELWINSFFIKITGRLSLSSLLFFTYPLGIFLCGAGIFSFFKDGQVKTWQKLILVMLLLNISGIVLPFYYNHSFTHGAYLFSYNSITHEKLFPVYLFMIAAGQALLFTNYKAFFFFMLCLPIINISTAPSVFVTLLFFILYLKYKKNDLINWKVAIGFLSIQAVFLILFYFPYQTGKTSSVPPVTGFVSSLTDIVMWNTRKNIFIKTLLQCAMLFAPYFLFFFMVFRFKRSAINAWFKDHKNIILFFTSIFIVSLCGWAIFNSVINSIQFFSNPGVAGLNVMIMILLILLVEKERSKKKQFIVCALVLIFLLPLVYEKYCQARGYNKQKKYGSSFVLNVKEAIAGINPIGAFLYDTSEYKSIFSKNSTLNTPALYLKNISHGFFPVSLSVVYAAASNDVHLNNKEAQIIANTTFMRFIQEQKSNGAFHSNEQSMYAFIVQFKIDYLLTVRNTVIPEILRPLIKKTIYDEVSGETFMILKHVNATEYK